MKQTSPTQEALALLDAGIPLSLLVDLMTLDVSRSREIASVERADTTWVHAA
jgi:hypothetical protein